MHPYLWAESSTVAVGDIHLFASHSCRRQTVQHHPFRQSNRKKKQQHTHISSPDPVSRSSAVTSNTISPGHHISTPCFQSSPIIFTQHFALLWGKKNTLFLLILQLFSSFPAAINILQIIAVSFSCHKRVVCKHSKPLVQAQRNIILSENSDFQQMLQPQRFLSLLFNHYVAEADKISTKEPQLYQTLYKQQVKKRTCLPQELAI